MRQAIIMAAGKGTRMNSDLPKVMHNICGKTMIDCTIDTLKAINVEDIVAILGYGKEIIEQHLDNKVQVATQMPQLGTAHAVMQATQLENKDGLTLVINGDCPLIKKETFEKLYELCNDHQMVVLTTILKDAGSYGRVIKDDNGEVLKIVEAKDCNAQQLEVKEINTGIYCFNNKVLFENLKCVKDDNAQKEYYITDMVEILNNKGYKVTSLVTDDIDEVQGINNQIELAKANKTMQMRINNYHMDNGVCMIDPNNTYIGFDALIGKNTVIYPNVNINGLTVIKNGTKILSNSYLENAIIGENCIIDSSKISDSEVKDNVTIGPFAHIRMHSVVDSKVRLGNFVELKNTKLGYDSRCAHLTYLGDSEIGSKVNIGCGVVTVNYDGKHKFKTIVKDGAFIGSNVNLIAPVTIGENAVVAAGSTCTDDVNDKAMAIARARQINKEGYGQKYKDKE